MTYMNIPSPNVYNLWFFYWSSNPFSAKIISVFPTLSFRPPVSAGKADASLSSSSLSVRDVLRQRYSVTWHPRLLYLIVSDGYMATVLRVLDKPSPALLLKTLLKDTSKDLEKASRILDKSQVVNKGLLGVGMGIFLCFRFCLCFLDDCNLH